MSCEEYLQWLHPYLDDELDLSTALTLESHLDQCPQCAREYRELKTLRDAIRSEAEYFRAPDRLQRRIEQSLDAIAGRANRFDRLFWFKPVYGIAASLAAGMIAVGLTFHLTRQSLEADRLTGEIVSSHVRSLMAEHLTDVASSDQHTVKPWFSGRLDFSPQVSDLTEYGFPLVGGRLDYLDSRPVTALVYRRRQHLINVFLWPPETPREESSVSSTSRQGYNLLSFQYRGMVYWVISDLNLRELEGLVERLRSS